MAIFTSCRRMSELVAPARPTPCETKTLSDMDDRYGNRVYIPFVEFFHRRSTDDGPSEEGPALVMIKAALAEALVYYYPMAGRMREAAGGKVVVDCTGKGVVFVEANAAVRLETLGTPPLPPYPCVEELLPDAGEIQDVVGKPIVFVQLTWFECGGFCMGLQFSHCIADGFGMIQFIKAIADVARGEIAPAVLPVWGRELLMARAPPNTSHVHKKIMSLLKNNPAGAVAGATPATATASMVCRYFVFGPAEVAALRSRLPKFLAETCTRFELLTAAIWRCRTAAWGFKDDHRATLAFSANVRRKWELLPQGYYGNAVVFHVVDVASSELRRSPLAHAVTLIREAKSDMSDEYVRSTVDFMAFVSESQRGFHGESPLTYNEEAYMVSDWTRLGEDELDLGWAQRVGGGVVMPSSHVSFNGTCRNSDGDELVVASMLLPEAVMERFDKEIAVCLKD